MENQNCLDSILEEVGEFGKYQRRICFFIFCVIIISHFGGEIYVFEAKQINHRCHVPGCDVNETEFKPSWWVYAIPSEEDQPSKCFKFSRFNSSSGTCGESDFNKEVKERCKEFVYETSEISILHDFNLQCDENVWKLTLPGTLFGAGLFIGLPISGILSDRFGRKTMLISTAVVSGVIAIIRSFSNSYAMYLSLEVLDSTTRAGLYAFCYVLGVELVGPKRRALVSLLNSSAYATGGMFVGGIAWLLQSWKTLVRVLYSFHFLAILCYWLVPESVRWLLANNQSDKAQNILLTLAKVNGKSISKENLNKLESYNSNKETIRSNSIKELFTSVTLTLRLINCSICWTCCIFLYNGLTVNSVDLSGNSYLDYILTIFVEIPGFATAYVIVDRIGRKISLIIGFLIASFACIASIFIPNEIYWLVLITYLFGKFGSSICLSVIYIITSEMFPTTYRNGLLATCSMFGRIGSMVSPQMPLLEKIWKPLPLTLFSSAGILAAFLTLLLPETMNTKLPNTIKEAEDIGNLNKFKKSKPQTQIES